jgi:hypothetical protein
MPNPKARLVTPTEKTNNESIKAFVDELKDVLGYDNSNWQAYSAVDDYSGDLTAAATAAYNACTAGDVLVTGGAAATGILAGLTAAGNPIPIIQAVGEKPASAADNLTGFQIDAQGTAVKHLNKLDSPVAVLHDNSTLSQGIYAALVAAKGAKTLTPLTASTKDALNTVTLPTDATAPNGFMLIPNAMFFKHRADVIKIVNDKKKASDMTTPLPIYYPERPYKKDHVQKVGVNVIGHDVLLSYRLAAHYANNCFTGYWKVTDKNLPKIQEAVQDSY